LPDEPVIDAKIDHVKTVERSTTIAEGSAKVHTVEHVLSALSGMGVDNCLIEMDANEPPIGDGSAQQYVELIKQAGIVEQGVPRPYYEITDTIHIETKGGSFVTIVPDSTFACRARTWGRRGGSRSITPRRSIRRLTSAISRGRAPSSTTRT
jgi:UDP-3-O-[3-hydroxymyristoyl] N-acetylglucosamine deacetylase/3-hydroxyacyl-[acyl-carrier-protein] dehydratase